MRRFLDRLYLASGALAALFIVAICVVVLLQVGANLIDVAAKLITGEPVGIVIPSYAEFAGFFLAAASFLALAHTLRRGDHIRVSLLITHVRGTPRRVMELVCIGVALAVSAYFAWFMFDLVLESFEYGDLSTGMVPVKLWVPQLSLALGLVVLAIALADEFVCVLRGGDPSYEKNSQAPAE
ncbi:MAG: TRAP transporter small permease [Gammaproteobacteria bacterium]|nr:TRAP transporter small permease [Gammaproteobacteria bacterium]